MDLSVLLEEALADRGNAVMLLAHPRDGENAVIQAGNGPFARILGWHPNHVAGQRLKELRPFVERPEDWTTLIAAVRSLAALTLDLRLRVKGREVWLGFSLTFKVSAASGDSYGIMIGRDITEARERNIRESESQRLLASVFLRIGAAVAIIDGEGVILMANPACQQLLRYGPGRTDRQACRGHDCACVQRGNASGPRPATGWCRRLRAADRGIGQRRRAASGDVALDIVARCTRPAVAGGHVNSRFNAA